MFSKILIANRGEIAVRIIRACKEMGIATVAIYSQADKEALHVALADESYCVGGASPADSYLNEERVIAAALVSGAQAIHPGYGFLSENAHFASLCRRNGLVFIGPTPESMEALSDKAGLKDIMKTNGLEVIPGTQALPDVTAALNAAAQIGYPVMLKASAGGGGRGIRLVQTPQELPQAYAMAVAEGEASFGDGSVYMEKFVHPARHIEVQVLADEAGTVVCLGERDCSVQRRHQKLIEESPSPAVSRSQRKKLMDQVTKAVKAIGYVGVGTLEFLLDRDGRFWFMEMNLRLQVEHGVTEMLTKIDLVKWQIRVAAGVPLNFRQQDVSLSGACLECRINATRPGTLTMLHVPGGPFVRFDTYLVAGTTVSPYYDSLLVKVSSFDRTFKGAATKSLRALREMRIQGIKTNISFLINVVNNPTFQAGKCYTTFIEETPELFTLSHNLDRASKILDFLGDKIVNVSKGDKPYFEDRVLPKYNETALIYGAKDEFKKLGAKGFTQKILGEKRLYITDTSMRDAQQSLIATRMRTKDIVGAAKASNAIFQNAFSVEAWGGATYDTAYRFLKESPWKRLEILSERMPNTLIQMLLRASNTVGYSSYPDNLVKEFIRISAIKGVDVFRIFDSLNWMESMKMPVEEALKTGKIVEGSLCYTGDITSPKEVKYTLDYYVKKAHELEDMGVHILAIKDMAGLLKPYAAKLLVETLKSELKIPVHLHTHDTTGAGVATVLKAAEAGVDIVDLAIESMSSCTSQPSLNVVVEALRGTERDTGLDFEGLDELSRYYEHVRKVYKSNESGMVSITINWDNVTNNSSSNGSTSASEQYNTTL